MLTAVSVHELSLVASTQPTFLLTCFHVELLMSSGNMSLEVNANVVFDDKVNTFLFSSLLRLA